MTARNRILDALYEVSKNRDHLTTSEFARAISKAPQTIRKNHCLTGEFYGIRPIKIGNSLLWSVEDVANLLVVGEE